MVGVYSVIWKKLFELDPKDAERMRDLLEALATTVDEEPVHYYIEDKEDLEEALEELDEEYKEENKDLIERLRSLGEDQELLIAW